MVKKISPFSFKATNNVPKILVDLNLTLAISTYQAGKVIFISAIDESTISQLPRDFNKPMGICLKNNFLAIASLGEISIFKNIPELAKDYPPQPKTYDSLFFPRATYYTGMVDIHDIAFTKNELIGINTQYSCICKIDQNFSFTPFWKPNFITELVPEDRCHLNGMAMVDDEPLYVTALGQTNFAEGWRSSKTNGGVLIHVPTNKIVLENLAMPHSPRVYNGFVYVLLSATGQLLKYDPQNGRHEIISELGVFVRGMQIFENYFFIGFSKIRKSSSGFKDLPIAEKAVDAGILIYDLNKNEIIGRVQYENSVDEIYDVSVILNSSRPGIVTPQKSIHIHAVSFPDASFWKLPKDKNSVIL